MALGYNRLSTREISIDYSNTSYDEGYGVLPFSMVTVPQIDVDFTSLGLSQLKNLMRNGE